MFNDHHIFSNNIYDNAFNLLKLQKLKESLDDGGETKPAGTGQLIPTILNTTWETITNIPDITSP